MGAPGRLERVRSVSASALKQVKPPALLSTCNDNQVIKPPVVLRGLAAQACPKYAWTVRAFRRPL